MYVCLSLALAFFMDFHFLRYVAMSKRSDTLYDVGFLGESSDNWLEAELLCYTEM